MPISLPRPTTARKAKGPAAPSAGQDQDGASGTSPETSGADSSPPPAGPTPAAAAPVATDRSTAIYGHDAGNGDILEIPVKLIAPNPHNDRDTGDVSAEAAHIKAKGLLQPISVMRAALYLAQWEESLLANPRTAPLVPAVRDAQWVIVFGERRWLATTEAGLKKIDAIVRDDLIEDSEEIITAENLLRKNPSPLEEARQFRRFVDEKGMSYADVELVSGRSKGHISKRIALLSYSPSLQAAIRDGSVGPTIAKEIADAVPEHEQQAAVVRVMLGDPPVHYQTAIAAVLAGRTDLTDDQSNHLPEQVNPEGAETAGAVSAGNGTSDTVGADTGQGAGTASPDNGSERSHETGTPNRTATASPKPGQPAQQKAPAKPTKEQQQTA
ncbi:ParB/RepB/Spo0J family partition protein, partial [Lysinibacillus fusiformis]|uniref:ParB/RepB/Spo0J family partition protein n=2 Tax=Bacillati TaxID=1783272 RepID=UPI003815851B